MRHAISGLVLVVLVGCGADGGASPLVCQRPGYHLCTTTLSCCEPERRCGTGDNGCPAGGCCIGDAGGD